VDYETRKRSIAAPRIRRAREDDALDVVFWFPDRPAVMRWGGAQLPDPLLADWLAAQFLSTAPEHYAMTDDDDRPIGLFGLRFHERERRAHLIRVALSPLRRGEGLSSQLLRGAANLARERRVQRVTLNVYGSNADARAAYERAGFFPFEFAKAREDASGLMVRMLKPL
jgi:ribosomal protein S18 acetylase RimI-like enzyme